MRSMQANLVENIITKYLVFVLCCSW